MTHKRFHHFSSDSILFLTEKQSKNLNFHKITLSLHTNKTLRIMKRVLSVITIAIIGLAAATSASAQFKFGLKAGVAVNSLKFNEDIIKADNRAGFTGGAMIEFTAPVLGIGLDASVMYVHRTADSYLSAAGSETSAYNEIGKKRDYIDIPLNLKWKINIPAVGKVVKPYIATGPAFAFLVSKQDASEFFKNKKCDISWNIGVGLELFSHLQVGASYGIGLTKALETVKVVDDMPAIDGKNKYWTITAAYLF